MTDESVTTSAAPYPLGVGPSSAFHVPQVARRSDMRWGVFCAACSYEVGDYIYACRAMQQTDWPPEILESLSRSRPIGGSY